MRHDLNGHLCEIVAELVRLGVPLAQARREFEKQFIVATLRSNDGSFSRSAKRLGVHRNTLRNKVSDLGITADALVPRAARSLGRRASRR